MLRPVFQECLLGGETCCLRLPACCAFRDLLRLGADGDHFIDAAAPGEDADAEIPMTEYEFKNTPEQISYFLQNQPFPPSFSRNQE